MDVPIDTSQMTEQELQFHYFKMHDADNNNKLDGCELVKSLIHWHGKINISKLRYNLTPSTILSFKLFRKTQTAQTTTQPQATQSPSPRSSKTRNSSK